MNILVCIKQVPDTTEIKIDPVTNTLIRAGVPSIVNPFDAYALEIAARIKDVTPETKIILLSMGPKQAEAALKECLAVGGDKAYLVSDRAFGGADTLATSYTLKTAIDKIETLEGKFDIIFCGKQAIDGDTAQVGPQISEHLDIPVISYAEDIKIDGDSVVVQRQYEDRYHTIKVKMPCLITALSELNQPRYMTPGGIFDAYREKEVKVITRADLTVDDTSIGLKGSPTRVWQTFTKSLKAAGTLVQLDAEDSAEYMLDRLKEKFII